MTDSEQEARANECFAMLYRTLGNSGTTIPCVSFGAGPVPGLMTGGDAALRLETVRLALDCGINWFDTAADYGCGASEQHLRETLQSLSALSKARIATKVYLQHEHLGDIKRRIRNSVHASLKRLGVSRITLVQLHNSITSERVPNSGSLTPHDVLCPGGVLEVFDELIASGCVQFCGLTGLGDPNSLHEVLAAGGFHTIQIPFNLLNPSAASGHTSCQEDVNYRGIMSKCDVKNTGALAIRVLAGGALADLPASDHTAKSANFPLSLFENDQRRARALKKRLASEENLPEISLRFAIYHQHVTSAIVGFSNPEQVHSAVTAVEKGPLPAELLNQLSREPSPCVADTSSKSCGPPSHVSHEE